MSVEKQIKMLCISLNISVSELARMCGTSPQAFTQKMKRDCFTPSDLKDIAAAAGCQYTTAFVLPDGQQIEY